MKISVKVRPSAGKQPESVVRNRLRQLQHDVAIEEVFPGEQSGRRAGLVIVTLDDVSEEQSEDVLKHLRADDDIEYAERATRRKPKR